MLSFRFEPEHILELYLRDDKDTLFWISQFPELFHFHDTNFVTIVNHILCSQHSAERTYEHQASEYNRDKLLAILCDIHCSINTLVITAYK